jgi:hypothetical protein
MLLVEGRGGSIVTEHFVVVVRLIIQENYIV